VFVESCRGFVRFVRYGSYPTNREEGMATRTKGQEWRGIGLEGAMAGILALLIDAREERTRDRKDVAKTEVVLAQAGLSIDDIAAVTGKKYDTVRMAIARGKKAGNG
jgi:hypothetical protein